MLSGVFLWPLQTWSLEQAINKLITWSSLFAAGLTKNTYIVQTGPGLYSIATTVPPSNPREL